METPSLSSVCLMLFIATICFAQHVEAIRCYVCNSHDHPDCFSMPNKNESFEVNCDPTDNVCRKQHQWIEGAQSGLGPDERVVRSCGKNETGDNPEKQCIHQIGLDNQQDQCFCTRNLCNSALSTHRKLQTGAVLTLFFVGAAALIRQY